MTKRIQDRLQLAEEYLLKGDYGSAFYHAYTTFVRSKALGQLETEFDSWSLVLMAANLIKKEFVERAIQRDLTLTPDNVLALLGEHSIHGTTFDNLVARDLERIRTKLSGIEGRLGGELEKSGIAWREYDARNPESIKRDRINYKKEIYNEFKIILPKYEPPNYPPPHRAP